MKHSPLPDLAVAAAAARACSPLVSGHRLAGWIGAGKPLASRTPVLRRADAPAAAAVAGITLPPSFRSAADVPALHRAFRTAHAAGWIRLDGRRAVVTDAVAGWPDASAEDVLRTWLSAFAAVVMEPAVNADEESFCAVFHAVHGVIDGIEHTPGRPVHYQFRALAGRQLELEHALCRGFGPSAWYEASDRLVILFAAFGLIEGLPGPARRTALADYADGVIAAPLYRTSAQTLLTRLARFGSDDVLELAQPWLSRNGVVGGARALLRAASCATPAERITAVNLVRDLGGEAVPAWREAAAMPAIGVWARDTLARDGEAAALPVPDQLWLTVDQSASALWLDGPECVYQSLADAEDDIDALARDIAVCDHPDAAVVARVLTEMAAAPPPEVMLDLEVTLLYYRPKVVRQLRMPARSTLDILSLATLVALDWDGDHLHAFTVGKRQYGDPSYLEEVRDEADVSLGEIFPKRGATIRFVYDMGAWWEHEIKLVGNSEVVGRQPSAVCVGGEGDHPIEYPASEEDEKVAAVPFDIDRVNKRMGPPWRFGYGA